MIKYRHWDVYVGISSGVVLQNKLNLHRLILPHKALQMASKRPQIIQSCVSHRLNPQEMFERKIIARRSKIFHEKKSNFDWTVVWRAENEQVLFEKASC